MALCPACSIVLRCLDLRERAAAYKAERISCLATPLLLQAQEMEALALAKSWKVCTCAVLKPEAVLI